MQGVTAAIARRGWIAPAVLLLELLRPLSFISAQALLVLEPLLGPLSGGRTRRYVAFLEDRDNLSRLLDALEAERGNPSHRTREGG
jgi:hypothetical protein